MERVAIIARLKEGSEQRAAELVGAGPPFDLTDTGIVRHSIYISASEAVFVFEGHEVEWIVDQLIDEPFHYELHRAFEQWREIVDTNLSAAFYLAREAWPIMRRQNEGVLVNISSAAARDPFPGFAARRRPQAPPPRPAPSLMTA